MQQKLATDAIMDKKGFWTFITFFNIHARPSSNQIYTYLM